MLNQVLAPITLEAFDEPWRDALRGSMLLRPFAAMKRLVPAIPKVGSLLQIFAFVIAVVLIGVLGARHFADDKNGLALISTGGFALWLLGFMLRGKEKRTPTAMDALVLLYLAINVIAAGASHYFNDSVKGLGKVACYMLSYFYFTSVLQGKPHRKVIILSVLTAAALIQSLYGFYQYHIHVEPLATWEDPTVESKGTRIFGWVQNPNLLAGYLIPCVALSASLGMAAISTKKWIIGIPIICISGLIAVAIILTGSRGGYLGLAAIGASLITVVVALLWQKKPKLRMPAIAGVIGLLVVGALALHLVPGFEQRVTSMFSGREHSSNSFRMNVYQSSFNMFKDNWWFGVGPGKDAFVLCYGLYMISGFDALGTYCVPLEVAVETGVVGLAIFTALIVACLARGHVAFWTNHGWERWIAAGAAAAMIGMMVHGLTDTVFFRPQVQFIFWLIVALLTTSTSEKSVSNAS